MEFFTSLPGHGELECGDASPSRSAVELEGPTSGTDTTTKQTACLTTTPTVICSNGQLIASAISSIPTSTTISNLDINRDRDERDGWRRLERPFLPQDRGNSATDCYFLHDPNTAATRQMAPPATSHSNVSAGHSHQRYTDVNQGGLPANTDSHRSSSFIPCCEMPIPTPMTYNGNTKWSAFVCSFENMSRAYQWSQEEMVHRMLTSLRGDAHEFVFTSLSQQERSDYFMLRKAIQNRFQPRYTEDDYISKLENLKLRERDNVTSFTAMLKHLVSKAYPMVDVNAQEKLSLR